MTQLSICLYRLQNSECLLLSKSYLFFNYEYFIPCNDNSCVTIDN
jgi:hypothetical protein